MAFRILEVRAEDGVLDLLSVCLYIFIEVFGVVIRALDEEAHFTFCCKALFIVFFPVHRQQIAACLYQIIGERRRVLYIIKIVNFDTPLAYSDLLAEEVASEEFAVHHDFNRHALRRVFHAKLLTEPVSHAVTDKAVVVAVGEQYPVLVFAEPEKILGLVELHLVRFLVIHPCGVAAAADVLELESIFACQAFLRSILVSECRVFIELIRDHQLNIAVALYGVIFAFVHGLDGAFRLIDV